MDVLWLLRHIATHQGCSIASRKHTDSRLAPGQHRHTGSDPHELCELLSVHTRWRSCMPRRSCSSMDSLVASSMTLMPRCSARRAHFDVFLCFSVIRSYVQAG